MDNFFDEEMQKTVFFPDSMAATEPVELRGKYFEDTRIYNVFPPELSDMGEHLGYLLPMGYEPLSAGLCGIETDKGAEFFFDGKPINVERYSLYQNIFSRNSGILETDVMSIKRAVILGCGSVGSLVALELARSGVGHFFLADPDTLEYHNLCRHQCGIEDVGDLKINALRRRLRNINPSVEVVAVDRVIQDAPKDLLDDFCSAGDTIFVGCADNRAADVYSNRISVYYDAPFISIGFWERAFAGEIFYHIPGKGMPCYECALGRGSDLSARVQANHHVYSMQESIEGLKFEPGISVDINFITCIGIKLIIDILNRSNEDYTPRLLDSLTQYTLICNTNNPEIGGEMVEIFSYPLQVTTSLVVEFRDGCTSRCKNELEEK